jgi:hypothetical protein
MKIATALLTFAATAATLVGTALPATADTASPKPLPGHCAGATVRTSVQTGSTQRTTNAWGNIALDLNANTGTSDCNGVWPGGQLFVAAAKCNSGGRFSSWRQYTGPGRMDIATDVLPNTCFVLTWYGTGGNDGNYFQGRVIWSQ